MYLKLEFDNLPKLLEQYDKVLVMYGADWCDDCTSLHPEFEKLADNHTEIPFVYVDSDKFPNSRDLAEFEFIPTIVAFDFSKIIGQAEGNNIDKVKSVLGKLK